MGMRNKKKGSAAIRVALAGMLVALSVVILFAGYATGVMDLTAIAAASVLSAIAVVELGGIYPYLVWGAVSAVAFMLVPGSLAAGYFIFGGIYPMLKMQFEKLPRIIEWVVKLLYGAAVLVVLYFASKLLFGEVMETGWIMIGLAVGYGLFFILYDYALSVAMTLYMVRLRPKLTFLKKLR